MIILHSHLHICYLHPFTGLVDPGAFSLLPWFSLAHSLPGVHSPSLALPSPLPPSPALPCMLPPFSALPSALSPSFTLPGMLPPSLALPDMLPPSLALPHVLPRSRPRSLLPAWLSTLHSPQSVPCALLPSLAFPGPSLGPPWRCPSLPPQFRP